MEGEDDSICLCPPVLGREVRSAYWGATMPVGQKCEGVMGEDELLPLLFKEVFEGVTPPEGMPTSPVEEAKPHSMMAIAAITSKEQAAKETS